MPKLFDGAMAFVLRNLHKVQAGQGVNSPGMPEIPPTVFEELLVNALIHRDYMVSAPMGTHHTDSSTLPFGPLFTYVSRTHVAAKLRMWGDCNDCYLSF
ncbi:MAG TPA: hypothetical protein VJ205_04265 [Gammaproteobacteria bacterium]|nr:hypothetical protein [Gammaproteobacteria bacterium]